MATYKRTAIARPWFRTSSSQCTGLSIGALVQYVVVALAVERRVQVDQVHARILQVLAHHPQVVSVVQGRHAANVAGRHFGDSRALGLV